VGAVQECRRKRGLIPLIPVCNRTICQPTTPKPLVFNVLSRASYQATHDGREIVEYSSISTCFLNESVCEPRTINRTPPLTPIFHISSCTTNRDVCDSYFQMHLMANLLNRNTSRSDNRDDLILKYIITLSVLLTMHIS
jgi:hypothetical protein